MHFLHFFTPPWRHTDSHVRRKTVEQTFDRGTLECILESTAPTDVRCAAAVRLFQDPHVRSHARRSAREAAVHVLDNEVLLREIAEHDSDPAISELARCKLEGTRPASVVHKEMIYAKYWSRNARQKRTGWRLLGLLFCWVLLGGFILVPLGVPYEVIPLVSFVLLVAALFRSIPAGNFRCPRCGNTYYFDNSITFIPRIYNGKCVHCGLPFGNDPHERRDA